MPTVQPASRNYFKALVAFMWVALPVIGFRSWQVWGQLPARLITHFNRAGRPNGWMTPQQSLIFSLGLTLFLLIPFTAILLYTLRRSRKPDASVWALLGLFYTIVGVETFIADAVLRYNLSATSMPMEAIAIILFVSIFIFTIVFLRAHRGTILPEANVFSEEAHGSRVVALIFLLPVAAEIAAALTVPIGSVRLALALPAAAMLIGAVFAWSGFRYVFSQSGVEISSLGFRLRSISAADIRSYAVDHWNWLGGYGIRGIGDRRAYVWGKRGVRIKTSEGEVFLGHSQPEKLVRDLDLMTHNHEEHEVGRRS